LLYFIQISRSRWGREGEGIETITISGSKKSFENEREGD